jgi:hypothetical protein
MSRRHHGRPNRGRHRHEGPRPEAAQRPAAPPADARHDPEPLLTPPVETTAAAPVQPPPAPAPEGPAGAPRTNGSNGTNGASHTDRPNGCTAPQLRRFIKSRPYVPMHELRRRFAIDGTDDDVTQVELQDGRVYVGLPAREGSLLGELLRGGEIGYELSFDPRAPIVVGVYPMRPVPRT